MSLRSVNHLNGIKKPIMIIGLIILLVLLQGWHSMQHNGMVKLNPQDYFDGTQLTLAKAIQTGDNAAVIRLAETTDLNTLGREDITLLFFAINETMYTDNPPDRLQIITDLVKAGADPLQRKPKDTSSPAERMAKANKGIWLKAMLDGGLSPNARGELYGTPIIFRTVWATNTETLKTLIKYGADINATNSLGATLVKDALDSSSIEHVKLLISLGADVDIKNNLVWSFRRSLARELRDVQPESEYYRELLVVKKMLDERDNQKSD